MSVKQRFNWLDNMRVDKPHLKAVDDSIIFDFKALLQGFVADSPYVLRGFDINNPGAAINGNASNLQVIVDSATVWMPAEADGSFLRVVAGTANETLNSANTKVTGSFTASAINYVSVKFSRATDPTTNDLVAFWDVDAEVEFTKTVPLGLVLNYQFVINTSGFGSNSAIAVVTTDASNNVIQISNAKNGMFRLGKGGSSPNSAYNWAYPVSPENPLTLATSGGPNPYAGGDWEIKTFKDWMDAIMTEIKAMKGSAYWYSPGSSSLPGVNLLDSWFDAVGSSLTGVGRFEHDNALPGKLTWTSDLYIRSIVGPLTYTIAASNITLTDKQVAYLLLVRNQDFQPANTFTFTNGSNIVTATANVSGIVAGDWIKFDGHDLGKWQKVQSVVGTTVTLTANYLGANAIGKALRAQGTYTMTVANPDSVPADANVFWLARRDDNAVPSSIIDTAGNSGAQRTSDIATIKTTTPHGLQIGQTVGITGVTPSSFNIVGEILTVPSATTFTLLNPGADIGPGVAGGGQVSVRASIFLRYFGELAQGEERQIDDNAVQNLLQFVGSESETDTTPPYTITPNALSPYQFTTNNNLTQAISAITGNVNGILTALDQPVYDETIEIVISGATGNQLNGPVPSGTTITIPTNSRLTGSPQQFYVVGKGTLQVFVNGQYLAVFGYANGWSEVGAPLSNSDEIVINQQLEVGDLITFRIGATGGPQSGSLGAPDDDFFTLPAESAASGADYVLIYDASASAYRKQLRSDFLTGVDGSLAINNISSNTTLTPTSKQTEVNRVDATSGNITITLPSAAAWLGKVYHTKKLDATGNSVILNPGSDTIDGASSLSFNVQYQSYSLFAAASGKWEII